MEMPLPPTATQTVPHCSILGDLVADRTKPNAKLDAAGLDTHIKTTDVTTSAASVGAHFLAPASRRVQLG